MGGFVIVFVCFIVGEEGRVFFNNVSANSQIL